MLSSPFDVLACEDTAVGVFIAKYNISRLEVLILRP